MHEQISIIVPVYRAYHTLSRCVTSILSQTWAFFELILVDDGSPDGSGGLCDALALADSRIRVIHQTNAGVSAARNAGLQAANGTWVLFVDADDALAPTALESALRAANESPNRIVVWPFTETQEKLPSTACANGIDYPMEKLGWLYLDCCFSMPWNKLFQRSVIESGPAPLRFDSAYSLGEDLLFCLAYCQRAQSLGYIGFFRLGQPQTFYETAENEHSLTQCYRADFCTLWMDLFHQLLSACETTFHCPEADLTAIRHSYLCTISHGIFDLCQRGTGTPAQRKQAAKTLLQHPELQKLCQQLKQAKRFSPLAIAVEKSNVPLLLWLWNLRCKHTDWYGKIEAIGQKVWNHKRGA